MSIIDKMKKMFGGDIKIIKNNQQELKEMMIKTGIEDNLLKKLTENGDSNENILKSLKKTLFCKEFHIKNANIQTQDITIALQVGALMGKKVVYEGANISHLLFKSQIKVYHSKDKEFEGLFINDQISKNNISINEKGNFIFINFTNKNLGKMLNLFFENQERVIGFSSSTSVMDYNRYFKKNFLFNLLKNHKMKAEPVVDEMVLLTKFRNSSNVEINFNEILFSLLKIEELEKSKMLGGVLSQFGVKITPEMMSALKKQKGIIQSMTEKERSHPRILEGNMERMNRIAKGSGSTIEEVVKLVSIIDTIRKKGGQFAAQMMNPMTMAQNLGK